MFNFLEKIWNRSEQERKTIAFVATLVLTAVVAFVWFGTSNIFNSEKSAVIDQVSNVSESSPGPIESLSNVFSKIGEEWEKMKDKF